MISTSVIIILREVLEAALLISLLLAMSTHIHLKLRWIITALCLGLGFAVVYANQLAFISSWFDGLGQEMVNTSLQVIISMMLAVGCCYVVRILIAEQSIKTTATERINILSQSLSGRPFFKSLLICIVALAIVREGSEIIIYIFGFASNKDVFLTVLLGGSVGLGIGVSIGVIFFYSLINITFNNFIPLLIVFSGFIAAGLLIQAINLLYQADFLEMQYFLWDSSSIISEESIVGQLLYAMIGYEATPSMLQVFIYTVILLGFFSLAIYFYINRPRSDLL